MTDNDKGALVGTLTESLEDYLEIIFLLLQENKVARVRDIARAKNVKTSSVTSALHRLAQEGLVEYHAREYVDLTDDGREFAFRVYQRHTFLKRFLVDLLQVDPETAERDACSMEHVLSVTTLDRMSSFAEFISYCPKVDDKLIQNFRDSWLEDAQDLAECRETKERGIWKRKDELASKLGIRSLDELELGAKGYIARIIGPDEVRRKLIQRGILSTTFIYLQTRSTDGSCDLIVSKEIVRLTTAEAAMVYVWVSEEKTG